MSEQISTEDFLKRMPPGYAIPEVTLRPEPCADFLVREESRIIEQLSSRVIIRTGIIDCEDVYIIPFLFKFGEHSTQIIETFLNYSTVPEIFKLLSEQDTIAFYLFGDNLISERVIKINNKMKYFFLEAIMLITRSSKEWSFDEFNIAKEEIYRRQDSPEDLWKELSRDLGSRTISIMD